MGFEQNLGSQIWQNWSLEFCEIQLTELSNILVKYGYAEFRIWKLNLGIQIRRFWSLKFCEIQLTELSSILVSGFAKTAKEQSLSVTWKRVNASLYENISNFKTRLRKRLLPQSHRKGGLIHWTEVGFTTNRLSTKENYAFCNKISPNVA